VRFDGQFQLAHFDALDCFVDRPNYSPLSNRNLNNTLQCICIVYQFLCINGKKKAVNSHMTAFSHERKINLG